MCKSMKWMMVTAGTAMLLASQSGSAADSTVTHTWSFASGQNPAVSDHGATAMFAPGAFASGWVPAAPVLGGGSTGCWDLGQNGVVTLSLGSAAGTIKSVSVKVSQWWDGGIYDDFVQVVVPSAKAAGANTVANALGNLGGWISDESDWEAGPGANITSVQISGGKNGALLNSLVVEAVIGTTEPPQLSITALGNGQLEISWPAAFSDMVLESTDALSVTAQWNKVSGPVTVGETTCSLVTSADGPARFYRLKQP